MSEFAGTLRERITIEQLAESRSPAGLRVEAWKPLMECMAAVRADGFGAEVQGQALNMPSRYRVTLRRRAGLTINDRVRWGTRLLRIRQVVDDPGLPDRLILKCEEESR